MPPEAGRQCGWAVGQSLSCVQVELQCPGIVGLVDVQFCPAGQPLCAVPGQQPSMHAWVVPSQMRPDVVPPQSASRLHPQNAGSVETEAAMQACPLVCVAHAVASPVGPGMQSTHRSIMVSHTGVAPVHAAVAPVVHCSHWPANVPDVTQAGVLPEQSAAVHARQVCAVVSQIGVPPEQSAPVAQPTQRSVVGSQIVVAPVHAADMPGSHCTQVPVLEPVVAHTPVAPTQSAAVQPRHTREATSQNGVLPAQSLFARQPTHVLVVASHTSMPVQAPGWVASQATQRPALVPVASHTGAIPAQSLLVHARHRFDVPSQIGVPPLQSLFDRQPRHVSLVPSHSGVAPVHAMVMPGSH